MEKIPEVEPGHYVPIFEAKSDVTAYLAKSGLPYTVRFAFLTSLHVSTAKLVQQSMTRHVQQSAWLDMSTRSLPAYHRCSAPWADVMLTFHSIRQAGACRPICSRDSSCRVAVALSRSFRCLNDLVQLPALMSRR